MKTGKWRIVAVILVCLMVSVLFAGCGNTYRITVTRGKDFVFDCPKRAKVGETVTVETAYVTDADMYFFVNGDPDLAVISRDGKYQFVMPDCDVSIEVSVVANGLA